MSKRNKASVKKKKAQAKSASKNSKKKKEISAYGVPVNIGKHGKGQRKAVEHFHSSLNQKICNGKETSGSNSTATTNTIPDNGNGNSSKKRMASWNKPSLHGSTCYNHQMYSNGKQEKKEFEKEFASLNERLYHEEQQKKAQRKHRKFSHKNKIKMSHDNPINFAPANFAVKAKTTEDLINDTTNKVAGQFVIHENQQQNNSHSFQQMQSTQLKSNRLQILAAQKRQEWEKSNDLAQNGKSSHDTTGMTHDNQNVFAVLGNGDEDSDDDCNIHKNSTPPITFQFTPASFQLPVSSSLEHNQSNEIDLNDL